MDKPQSSTCINGHVDPPRGKNYECKPCKIERQRAKRALTSTGLKRGQHRNYPEKGSPKFCRRGHPARVGFDCVGCWAIQRKKDREKDVEKARNRYRTWLKNNRDKARAATLRWQAANLEQKRAIDHNYRAAKLEAYGTLTGDEWKAILKKYRGRCAYCNKRPPKGENLQADHVIPLQGEGVRGSNLACNIVPACSFCNSSKKNRLKSGMQHTLFDVIKADEAA